MRRHVAVAVFAWSFSQLALAQEELAEPGRPAPMFRLPVYNAAVVGTGIVGLDKFVGPEASDAATKTVLLSFTASWCGPCKKEMPYLQTLHEKYKDFGLRVLIVSIDDKPEGMKQIEELIALNRVTFPVLKDRFNLVARRWLGNEAKLPSVFLVKPDGVVSFVHRGYDQDASVVFAREVEESLGITPGTISGPAVASTTPAGGVTTTAATVTAASGTAGTGATLAADKQPVKKAVKKKPAKKKPASANP